MKVHCKYRPYLCVMKDDTRPEMCHVMLDVEARKLYATNGHIALIVQVQVEPDDKGGLIDAAGYRVIRDRYFADGPTNGLITIDCSSPDFVESNGVRWPRPKIDRRPYPPVEGARPEFDDKPTHTFSINANYLRTLALAMGEPGGDEIDDDDERRSPPASVSLTFLATETLVDAIVVRQYDNDVANPQEGAEALLMPLRS